MENKETVYIFWTGGWDSTFRFLQLAEKDIIIQPLYVHTETRPGNTYEQRTMQKIIKEISKNPKFKAEIKDIVIYDRQVILDEYFDKEIFDAHEKIKPKYTLGDQYLWFSLLAKHINKKIEVCVEYSERSKAYDALHTEGKLVEIDKNLEIIDIENSSEELIKEFSFAIFPTMKYSKIKMKQIAKEKGWYEIMKMTWFCHNPINNKPCGKCNPCKDAMNEGMNFRMPIKSKFRYYYYHASLKTFLTNIFSIKNVTENNEKKKIMTVLGIKIEI